MSNEIRSAAANALQNAREGYWIRRETRQLEAAEAGLQQLDRLSPTGGDAEALRLVKAAAAALPTDRSTRLEILKEGLSVLASGAAAGVGPQAALAVRLLTMSGNGRDVGRALLKEVAALAPGWGAQAPLATRITGYAHERSAKAALQSLAQGGPKTAVEEAALALEVSDDRAKALQGLLQAHPLKEVAEALAEAQKLGVQAEERLLEQAAKDPADRVALSAAVLAELPSPAGAEALARLAVRGRTKWQPLLKDALALPAPNRDAMCASLLAAYAGEAPDAETYLRAAATAVSQYNAPDLAGVALDAADRARGAHPWHAAMRGALQVTPDLADWVATTVQEPAPEELSAACQAISSAMETCQTFEDALKVGAVLLPQVQQFTGSDADQRAAAALVSALADLPWPDAAGGHQALVAAMNALPEPGDPPAVSPSPLALAPVAVAALSSASTPKNVELASGVILDALAALGDPDIAHAAQLVQKALPKLPNDHAQKAALGRILPDLLAGHDAYYPAQLLADVLEETGIDLSARVAVAREMLPGLAARFPGGMEADRLAILDRIAALDLESDSVRQALMTEGLYATLPEDRGLPGVAGLARACSGDGGLSFADAEAVTATAVDSVRRWAEAAGHPTQAAQVALLERVLVESVPDDASETRRSLLSVLADGEDREGPGWCASVALEVLPQDDTAPLAVWRGLSAGVVALTPEGPARDLVAQMAARKVETAEEAVAALEGLARLEDEELMRMIGGGAETPGEIEVEEEQVTIGGVTVGRNRRT